MQKHVITGILGLVVGGVIGFWGANSLNRTGSEIAAPSGNSLTVGSGSQSVQANGAGMSQDVADTLAAAEREPGNFVVQMKTGDLYAQIGRFEQAIEFYKRGLALRPNDKQALLVVANAYFDAGQYEVAGDHYAKVLEIEPGNIAARTDLGTTYVLRASPDYDRAVKEFEAALSTDPKHEPSLYNLGIAMSRKGDQAAAESVLARLESVNPSSDLIPKLKQNIARK